MLLKLFVDVHLGLTQVTTGRRIRGRLGLGGWCLSCSVMSPKTSAPHSTPSVSLTSFPCFMAALSTPAVLLV